MMVNKEFEDYLLMRVHEMMIVVQKMLWPIH